MGKDSGECIHQLDVLWVCGSTTHTSGGRGWGTTATASCKCFNYPTEVCLHVEMKMIYTCYITEITNHCYTAKTTLSSLVGDCCTPVSQYSALARGWPLVVLKNIRLGMMPERVINL